MKGVGETEVKRKSKIKNCKHQSLQQPLPGSITEVLSVCLCTSQRQNTTFINVTGGIFKLNDC